MSFTLSPRLRRAYEEKAAEHDVPALDIPWTINEIAVYIGVKRGSAVAYRDRAVHNRKTDESRPGDLPEPDGSTAGIRGQWWYPRTIIKWDLDDRPGQGVGGGRPWHKEKNR